MEAMACSDGLYLARQLGAMKLSLETGCLELVKLWKSLDEQRSEINVVLQEIRMLSRSFDEFTYANRTCNKVVHMCAKQVTGEETLEECMYIFLSPLQIMTSIGMRLRGYEPDYCCLVDWNGLHKVRSPRLVYTNRKIAPRSVPFALNSTSGAIPELRTLEIVVIYAQAHHGCIYDVLRNPHNLVKTVS
ncbi:hypothetical protein EJB05_50896, partial [Eragrostis curvula]